MSNVEEKEVTIKEFPIHKLPLSATIIAIGGPGKGKTTLLEDICYQNKHKYPAAMACSGTEDANGSFGRFIKPLFIANEYNHSIHEKFIIRQKKVKGEKYPGCIFIMDDCNTDREFFKTKFMKAQFKNGSRHWDNLFIIGSHYALDMPPELRKTVSYVFLFNEPAPIERKKLYENFAIGCSYEEFCQLMDELCNDHTCLVFDKRVDSSKLEECVFYYKARVHDKWEIGCSEYKKWSDDRYNKSFQETII